MTKLTVKIAKAEQTAIEALGKEAKTIYYLIIGEGDDKLVINIGEKTYKTIEKLISKNYEMDNKKKAS